MTYDSTITPLAWSSELPNPDESRITATSEQSFAYIDDISYLYEATANILAQDGVISDPRLDFHTTDDQQFIQELVSLTLETLHNISRFYFFYEFILDNNGCKLIESNAQFPINARFQDFLDEYILYYISSISDLVYITDMFDEQGVSESDDYSVQVICRVISGNIESILLRITYLFEQHARNGTLGEVSLHGLYQIKSLEICTPNQCILGPIVNAGKLNLEYRSAVLWLKLERVCYSLTKPDKIDL